MASNCRAYRRLSLVAAAVASVVLLFGLSACGMSHFSSEESAERYVVDALSKKYSEDFQITEVINYKEEPIGIKWISVKAASTDAGQDTTVYARDTGPIEDDYHVHFFEDEIIRQVAPLCEEQGALRLDSIEVDGKQSAALWDRESPIEDYIEGGEYEIDVIAVAVPGASDEEIAADIQGWAMNLAGSEHDVQLTVLDGEDAVIFTEDIGRSVWIEGLSVQDIIVKMNEWRGTAETLQHYEQWKSER